MREILSLVGIVALMLLGAFHPALAQKKNSDAPPPAPRQAVLGNDATALLKYCVFQSQVYSPGVTFCTGKNIQIECITYAGNPGTWSVVKDSKNCDTFK